MLLSEHGGCRIEGVFSELSPRFCGCPEGRAAIAKNKLDVATAATAPDTAAAVTKGQEILSGWLVLAPILRSQEKTTISPVLQAVNPVLTGWLRTKQFVLFVIAMLSMLWL
jgi:hypothetical protein